MSSPKIVAEEPGFRIPYLRIFLQAYQYSLSKKKVMMVQIQSLQIEPMDDSLFKD